MTKIMLWLIGLVCTHFSTCSCLINGALNDLPFVIKAIRRDSVDMQYILKKSVCVYNLITDLKPLHYIIESVDTHTMLNFHNSNSISILIVALLKGTLTILTILLQLSFMPWLKHIILFVWKLHLMVLCTLCLLMGYHCTLWQLLAGCNMRVYGCEP